MPNCFAIGSHVVLVISPRPNAVDGPFGPGRGGVVGKPVASVGAPVRSSPGHAALGRPPLSRMILGTSAGFNPIFTRSSGLYRGADWTTAAWAGAARAMGICPANG